MGRVGAGRRGAPRVHRRGAARAQSPGRAGERRARGQLAAPTTLSPPRAPTASQGESGRTEDELEGGHRSFGGGHLVWCESGGARGGERRLSFASRRRERSRSSSLVPRLLAASLACLPYSVVTRKEEEPGLPPEAAVRLGLLRRQLGSSSSTSLTPRGSGSLVAERLLRVLRMSTEVKEARRERAGAQNTASIARAHRLLGLPSLSSLSSSSTARLPDTKSSSARGRSAHLQGGTRGAASARERRKRRRGPRGRDALARWETADPALVDVDADVADREEDDGLRAGQSVSVSLCVTASETRGRGRTR